jgi:acetoin utilization deacetylase AcuC-like enzyme
VTQDALTYLADELRCLSPNGKIIAALEGGYNCKVMPRAVEAVIRVRAI